jgi:two-component system, OmpR family, phosphate regulon response regulator PhoB
MLTNVLIVESESRIAESLSDQLRRTGFSSTVARNAEDAWQLMSVVLPDLILLNWILANRSGATLANQLRLDPKTKHIPIVMLGNHKNKRRDVDVLYDELAVDADGYIVKPERHEEVTAGIAAALRQRQIPRLTDEPLSVGTLTLDPSVRRVYVIQDGERIVLPVGPTELRLLYFFMTHPERLFSRTDLQDEVWDDRNFRDERTVSTYVERLRASLRPGACDYMIEVVRGLGYRFSNATAAKAQ